MNTDIKSAYVKCSCGCGKQATWIVRWKTMTKFVCEESKRVIEQNDKDVIEYYKRGGVK